MLHTNFIKFGRTENERDTFMGETIPFPEKRFRGPDLDPPRPHAPPPPEERPGVRPVPHTPKKVRPGAGKPIGLMGRVLSLFSNDLAIDLGTANTLIYMKRHGVVLNESSVVALRNTKSGAMRLLASGNEAKQMMGKTPANVRAIRPMQDGVIADFEAAGTMLRHFIGKVKKGFFRPRMIIAVPSGITPIERRAVRDSAIQAGAKSVHLVEEPMAAAIGADMPVTEPTCNMVVDIGGGTTEIAVISLSGIVANRSIKVAGDQMDEAIIRYIRKKHNFVVGERTAEAIKINAGDAWPDINNPDTIEVKGWEVITGRPKIFRVNSLEIREAVAEQLIAIVEGIRTVLERTPQELAESLLDNGLVLTGGVAQMKNLDRFIYEQTGIPVQVADNPLLTIALGSGKMLDDKKLFQQVTS